LDKSRRRRRDYGSGGSEGLTIEAVDNDTDYLGIQIRASNGRFAGYAEIYASNNDLSEFAERIAGFPESLEDQRSYEFGSPNPAVGGGYCTLKLRCLDRTGHVAVDVVIDGKLAIAPESARFSFKAEPSAIDQFVRSLRVVENNRTGSATIAMDSVA
jgi:hypothetical protein